MKSREHIAHLDGLRGLAALYVVAYHTWPDVDLHKKLNFVILRLIALGHYAVAVFIVLSGYLLMLPYASDPQRTMDLRRFFQRRAWRILPPYYAALLLVFGLYAALPWLSGGGEGVYSAKPIDAPAILSHLALIHNLHLDWMYRIDRPMWSVALEWQIYFLMPFLMLPVWRRWGNIGLLTVTLIVSAALMPALGFTFPWYIALFSLGMAASTLTTTPKWMFAVWILAAGFLLIGTLRFPGKVGVDNPVFDLVVGIATASLLITLRDLSVPSRIRSVLASPLPVWLGAWSYSLYLLHEPLLIAARDYCRQHGRHFGWLEVGVSSIVVLLICYAFYWCCERIVEQRRSGSSANALPSRLPRINQLTVGAILGAVGTAIMCFSSKATGNVDLHILLIGMAPAALGFALCWKPLRSQS